MFSIDKKLDVVIVGAGPAGAATAMGLANTGLSVGVLDKSVFPRDKICGDALSVDVINQLSMLSPELSETFDSFHEKISSYGVRIFSPDGNHIDIPFHYHQKKSSGYICQRLDFDNILRQHLNQYPTIEVFEDCLVENVEDKGDHVIVHTSLGPIRTTVIVGADGAQSVVAKKMHQVRPEKNHYSAGLRIYYEGVTSFHLENFIELHFFRDILPGYLWIFPLPENKANVGIGMLSSAIARTKINLKGVLNTLITTHPALAERFKNARPLETVKGFGLPLGSKKRSLSGNRFLLTGDAASLIDPFTGEGIANAIRSGRIAASHLIACFKENSFSAAFNKQYDNEIYKRMWGELRLSHTLQKLCRYPGLFNFTVRKANQNREVHQLLVDALSNVNKKRSLVRPGFYYRLLFSK